jgi:hypothetical protein
MKIGTTTVSCEGYGDSAAFESRFVAFQETLEKAKGEGCDLLCLPGGYFCVDSDLAFEEATTRIVREAKRRGIALAVGIDYSQAKQSNKKKTTGTTEDLVRKQALPSFSLTWSPQQHERRWRQRSVTSRDQWLVSDEACAQSQTLRVSGENTEILTCGELFNERIRNSVVSRHPSALIDLSHNGKGFRADPSLKSLAQAGKGMYTFCCTHADMKKAMKRAFAPGGGKQSRRNADAVITGKPRIEMKVWTV